MFAAPAFPRIPLFGSPPNASDATTDAPSARESGGAPPVVPFDTLVLSAEKMMSEHHTETYKRNATSISKYEQVVSSIDSEDAREFLAALVFLGTRSTSRITPSPTP